MWRWGEVSGDVRGGDVCQWREKWSVSTSVWRGEVMVAGQGGCPVAEEEMDYTCSLASIDTAY